VIKQMSATDDVAVTVDSFTDRQFLACGFKIRKSFVDLKQLKFI